MADFKASFELEVRNSEEIKKKIEEFEKALEELKRQAEDTSKPLEDTAKAMDDMGKSAADVDKDLKDTSGALDDVSKSAGDISKDLDNVGKSFDDISKSAVDVSTDLKDADSAFSDIASNADGAVSSMDAVKSSFEGISESAVEADQNIAAATTGLEGVGTATESAAAGADALVTSLDNIAASAQEAETNISAAANGIDGIGTSIAQAETALDGLGSAFDGAGTSTTSFNDVLTSTGTQAQAASGGLTPLNTVLGQVGGASQQAQGGIQGFNSNIGIMTGFIGTAASGAIQFVSALNALHGAQIKVDVTQAKLSTTSEALAKAQAKLNELLASGTATTAEIEQATLDLTQATDRNNIAIERAGKAQDDLNLKYAKFATDVLPGLIQSITSTVAVASQLHDKFSGTETSGLINFFTEGETGAKGFASALGVLALSAGTAWAALELYKQLPSITSAWTKGFEGDLDGVIKSLEEYRDVIKANPLLEPVFGQRLDAHIAQLKLQRTGIDDNTNALRQYGPTLETGGALLDKFGESQDKSAIKADQQTKILEGQKPVWQALVGDIEKFLQEHNLFGQQLDTTTPKIEKETVSLDATAAAHAKVKEEVEAGRSTIDEYVGTIEGVAEKSNAWAEANATLTDKLRDTNEALIEHVNQTNELVGSDENATNAILKIADSLAQHKVNIDQLNTSLSTSEGQLLSYQNAVAAGDEAFLKWVQSTRDAATETETFRNRLAGAVNEIGGFPQWVEPTIENMKAFKTAHDEGGEAVEEWARISLESYRGLVEDAKPLFDDLKAAWTDIYSGTSATEAADAIAAANDKIAQNVRDNEQAIATSAEGTAPKIKSIYDGVDWEAVTESMKSPFAEAFEKLPPLVQASLDETERSALAFSAQFASIAEQAGMAWADNLAAHVSMGETFDQALAAANQAALDIITPFVQEHPETAQMIQPLLNALQSGTPQAVQEALKSLAEMPGPFQEQAQGMLTKWNEMTGQLGPSMKTGVEGAVQDLGVKMQEIFSTMTERLLEGIDTIVNGTNTKLDTIQKKDPVKIALDKQNLDISMASIQQGIDNVRQTRPAVIDADVSAKETKIQPFKTLIDGITGKTVTMGAETKTAGDNVDTLKGKIDGLASGATVGGAVAAGAKAVAAAGVSIRSITINADTTGATTAIDGLQSKLDAMAGKEIAITVNTGPAGIAITGLQGQIDGVHGKEVAITVNTGPAGIAITGLQTQIDGVHGKEVAITVNTGPAGLAITGLQGQIDGVHGKEVAITVNTGPAGIAITTLQGDIDAVHGTNVFITVDTSRAQEAIRQLQQQINTLQQSMSGIGTGYTPGYQSPYGSYLGAYGAPGMAKGFGPAIINRPTRILVGEAGPELVSVIPMKNKPVSKTAAAGMGWYGPSSGGLGYGAIPRSNTYGQAVGALQQGQGQLWQSDAEEEQYKREVQASMQQGSQQGTQQGFDQSMGGMQNAVQEGASQGVQEGMQQGYQQAPSNTELWGAGRFTWGGGAAGTQLGGGNMGGAQYPTAPSNTELWGHPQRFTWTGGAQGTQLGSGMGGGGGGGSSGGGMMPWPPTGGGGGGASRAPGVYTGQVPASYGRPLGQSFNGVTATILPGQGPRGPPMQAAFGMHRKLRRDTLIQAHRNERVDISPGANAAEAAGKASDYVNATMDRITALLEKLLSQGSTFKVDFNVDGRKMSSVAAKHMGTTGYGDK